MSEGGLRATIVIRRSADFALDVEINALPGKTTALLGPNGAGKSTVVGAIAGLIPINAGKIELNGTLLDDPGAGMFIEPERRRVGVMFQDLLLFPHLTVEENVGFGLRSTGVQRSEAVSRARDWLEMLGMEATRSRRPNELSGGEAQRVALARALVTEPLMLLLDEPLSALDVSLRSELRRVLVEHLDAFAGPRLLITHDPNEAFLLADVVYVIEQGAITHHGTADDIRLRPRTRYAADLAGTNLLRGVASGREIEVGAARFQVAEDVPGGPVILNVHPTAIAVHQTRPGGSPRNSWQTTVEAIERLGERVRLLTGPPVKVTVEITRNSADELGLDVGSAVWVAVKATEIGVESDS